MVRRKPIRKLPYARRGFGITQGERNDASRFQRAGKLAMLMAIMVMFLASCGVGTASSNSAVTPIMLHAAANEAAAQRLWEFDGNYETRPMNKQPVMIRDFNDKDCWNIFGFRYDQIWKVSRLHTHKCFCWSCCGLPSLLIILFC